MHERTDDLRRTRERADMYGYRFHDFLGLVEWQFPGEIKNHVKQSSMIQRHPVVRN